MSGDTLENAGQCSDFDRMVMRNHFMVFSILLRGYPNMGALLSIDRVTQNL